MAYRNIFKRYEVKYLLNREQKLRVLAAMEPYMMPDKYFFATIRNLYFDTDNYRLIRHSMEKPAYKEKLRLRSYCQPDGENPVFVELKKKYAGVVYKRRLAMPLQQAMAWVCDGKPCPVSSQIADEINYFMAYYGALHPKVFLSYDREAYCCRDGGDLRVTFDTRILCRQDNLMLNADVGGVDILDADEVLMEIKTAGAIPLWMSQILTRERIFKTSFSKYATAYQTMIYNGGFVYAADNF